MNDLIIVFNCSTQIMDVFYNNYVLLPFSNCFSKLKLVIINMLIKLFLPRNYDWNLFQR